MMKRNTILFWMGLCCGIALLTACTSGKPVRLVSDFTDNWKFFPGDDPAAKDAAYNDSLWRTLNLPHDWSMESDFSIDHPATPEGGALPGGTGWYRKEFTPGPSLAGKNVYIDFDGIYHNSRVWLNGRLLGERPYGYSSFRYDLTPHLKIGEKNVIAVRVDNSQHPNSRWHSGSGIFRNVWLTAAHPVHIDHWGTYVTATDVSAQSASVQVAVTLKNNTGAGAEIELVNTLVDAAGKKVAQASSAVSVAAGGSEEAAQTLAVKNPRLWSTDNPYLYTVRTQVKQNGEVIDDYETPTGIRYFSFDADRGFLLNGEPVKIKGVCNHHNLGCLGAAVSKRAIERQLEILKEMGCNGIRTAHNPPAPELLDLCDRMGFIVMDEAFDAWRINKRLYDYSIDFPQWHERDLTDFVMRDRNHPSVFMWSVGNEIMEQHQDLNVDTLDVRQASILLNFTDLLNKKVENKDENIGEMHVNSLLALKLANIVKALDPSRPVTSGNNNVQPSNYLFRSGAMDIIGFNYYTHTWTKSNVQQHFPGKAFFIPESTSGLMSRGFYMMPSDSMYIWPKQWDVRFERPIHQCSAYDNCHVPWGTTHESSWRIVKNNAHIAGIYIWTGFDYLGEPTPFWWPSRSSYFGIIDLAGFPKDVYYMYQSEWSDKDVLHIFPHWNWKEGEVVDVWAYYNHADEVELFLNGESLGRKSKPEDVFHVWWRVPYQKGTLKAISYKDGKEVLTQEVKTTGEPASIRLTADRQTIAADGKDMAFVTVEALDSEGNVVPTAGDFIRFEVEGHGTIAGTDNGDPTDPNSLKKPARSLFNGKALVVVQSNSAAGVVKLKASSEKLKSAAIELRTKN
jgi:beta-galactosidase